MFPDIYKDIAKRTNGDIYSGVVGPVRTGKSTFIKRFMELLVIPNIENKYKKERATDELPQSGSGKSIMTCEPKFVPNEAVKIQLGENSSINVRLIDCVGYVVRTALGATEDGMDRMVQTPWDKEMLPFSRAAEIGTKKVITEHSTIGIVLTTDASITDIERSDYVSAEERVVEELKAYKKPFVIVLNSTHPENEETLKLKSELEEKYLVPVLCLDVLNMNLGDIENILTKVLYEFPIVDITYRIPKWAVNLSREHWLNTQIEDFISYTSRGDGKIRSVLDNLNYNLCESFNAEIDNIDLSSGTISSTINIDNNVFYKIMSEENNISLKNESDLFTLITELLKGKNEYDLFNVAISSANKDGYGLVSPTQKEIHLSTPEIYNDGGKYGVKLEASANILHIIKTEISSEVSPVIGNREECEGFYNKILTQYETDEEALWETEFFGRSLRSMIDDNIKNKLYNINDESKIKINKFIERVSNSKKGGLYILWI